MKFDHLYKQVFLTEQDEEVTPPTEGEEEPAPQEGGVPMPDNYSVEPAPIAPISGNAGDLSSYRDQLNNFAKTLQNTDEACLQKLVSDMDSAGSLFAGISRELSSRIVKLSYDAKEIATIIDGFILNSKKRQRDIASGQQQ